MKGPVTDILIYYAANIVGGADSITVTFPSYVSTEFGYFEYTGMAQSNVLDSVASNSLTNSAPPTSSGSVTTTQANDLLFSVAVCPLGGVVAVAPLTQEPPSGSSFYHAPYDSYVAYADQITSQAGTYSTQFTYSEPSSSTDPAGWASAVVAFKLGVAQ